MALLPALWAGVLLCVAGLATPAPFAVLDKAAAGQVVGHIFAREAPLSLLLGMALLLAARRSALARAVWGQGSQFSLDMGLALGTLVCTVLGYYVLQPMMELARQGQQGALSFGQLHGLSFSLFGLKIVLVLVLAWRVGPVVASRS
nr:DUF4149 domain-containing protein [Ideonella oryzae]